MSDIEDSDATVIAIRAGSDEELEAGSGERWTVREATRPLQYVPLSRNSQLLLMRKVTMQHMWSQAVDVMTMLLTDARHPPLLLFRYGMLVLQHYAPANDYAFRQYYRETMAPFVMRFLTRGRREKEKVFRAVLMNINKKEIVIDVSALLFAHNCDEEIDELYEWMRNDQSSHRIRDYNDKKAKNRMIDTYYTGYEAYMRFLNWRRGQSTTAAHLQEDVSTEVDEVMQFNDQESSIVDHLTSVVKSKGSFGVDLFLSSLLQMFESKAKYAEALAITDFHSSNHTDDLHAHLRRYDILEQRINQIRQMEDDIFDNQIEELIQKKVKCFEQIVRLSPDDPLVRDVCDSEDPVSTAGKPGSGDEALSERIQLLMNFVDYRANMQDVTAWQAIYAITDELSHKDQRAFRKFRRFFTCRVADYWEHVHFNVNHLPHEHESLIQCKKSIAELCEVCSKYRKAAHKWIRKKGSCATTANRRSPKQ